MMNFIFIEKELYKFIQSLKKLFKNNNKKNNYLNKKNNQINFN